MDEPAAAREALDRFTTAYHLHPPPVDVEQLCESLCCLRIRTSDDLAAIPGAPDGVTLSGMLLPARKEVWVSEHEPWERRRFSIAHEVGHYLLHVGEIWTACSAGPPTCAPIRQPRAPARARGQSLRRRAADARAAGRRRGRSPWP